MSWGMNTALQNIGQAFVKGRAGVMEMRLQVLTLNFLVTLSTWLFLAQDWTCKQLLLVLFALFAKGNLEPLERAFLVLNRIFILFCFTLLETRSLSGAQAGLKLVVLLCQPDPS